MQPFESLTYFYSNLLVYHISLVGIYELKTERSCSLGLHPGYWNCLFAWHLIAALYRPPCWGLNEGPILWLTAVLSPQDLKVEGSADTHTRTSMRTDTHKQREMEGNRNGCKQTCSVEWIETYRCVKWKCIKTGQFVCNNCHFKATW